MLEIAGGIILAVVILCVFGELIVGLLVFALYIALGVGALWIMVELGIGMWGIVHHEELVGASKYVISLAFLLIFIFIWSEFAEGFTTTRWILGRLVQVVTPENAEATTTGSAPIPEQIRMEERRRYRVALRKKYAHLINPWEKH